MSFSHRNDLQRWDEDIWLAVPSNACSRRLLFGCFYRPPNSNLAQFCSALEACFSEVDFHRADVFLLGDFNATIPPWLPSDSYKSAGSVLEPLFLQLSLSQLVSSPTHF